ncbi:integrating conjugative element protein [Marinobacter adhaerens]|nr:integrating conjugative element protein [Marinobacter adhaerens]
MDYQIGGGLISGPPTKIHSIPILSFGAGWDLNMACGEFDPKMTVKNQLNGLTDGFKNMMDNVINSATAAVASLPALAIQKADPGLYDLLQQGILQGKMDFEFAESSCQEMANLMMGDSTDYPWEKFKMNAKVADWSWNIGATGGDAVAAKENVDGSNHGDAGSEWVCNSKKGGAGQPPIRALRDVVMVGYNVLFDRNDSCDSASVSVADGQGNALWEYWSGPIQAADWAVSVVGDSEIRTCDNCKKITSRPGKGLAYRHRDMEQDLYDDLEDLVDGTTALSWQNLNRVSAPPGVRVTDLVIKAIRKRNPTVQEEMLRKLSSEIAYTRLVEQGRFLTQMLRSGVKEPNVANMDTAIAIIDNAIDHLNVELAQLDQEIETREAVAERTIGHLLGTEERIYQNTNLPSGNKPSGLNSFGVQ